VALLHHSTIRIGAGALGFLTLSVISRRGRGQWLAFLNHERRRFEIIERQDRLGPTRAPRWSGCFGAGRVRHGPSRRLVVPQLSLHQSEHPQSQALSESGTLPPFSASLIMTCLCSQIFMLAESFMSPE
jgi:hypothetical protein